jgi:hypothetical protein
MMPPSPSSSALITSSTYLTVTISVTAQKISDTMPYTPSIDVDTGRGLLGSSAVWTV